jgi:hypothetical protein
MPTKEELYFLSHTYFVLLWLFWRWDLVNYLPRLAFNHNLPNLSLPNSYDYRCEAIFYLT